MANYIGVDGSIRNDELKHWKYIKKIKSGSGWRYFYTPDEIRAYYKEEQGKADNQYKKDMVAREKRLQSNRRGEAIFRGREKHPTATDKEYSKFMKSLEKQTEKQYKRDKDRAKFKRKVSPAANTAKAVANKPIEETKKDIKDVKDYYKWQERKANKTYRREQREIKEATSGARSWNDYLSKEGGYGENSRAKGKAIALGITAGSNGAKTISSIKRFSTPKTNTGKAIVNRTLKKEINAERKRIEKARKQKQAVKISKSVVRIGNGTAKAVTKAVKQSEARKNRSGSKSYKSYNRW